MKKFILPIVIAGFMSLALVGCGSSATTEKAESSDSSAAAASASEDIAATSGAAEEAEQQEEIPAAAESPSDEAMEARLGAQRSMLDVIKAWETDSVQFAMEGATAEELEGYYQEALDKLNSACEDGKAAVDATGDSDAAKQQLKDEIDNEILQYLDDMQSSYDNAAQILS